MRTITVKLTDTEAAALDDVAKWFYAGNRSKALTHAIALLFDLRKLKPDVQDAIHQERRRHRQRRN